MRNMTDAQRKAAQALVRQRVQALLAERFQLKLHKESKESPVYALTVAKNGPKFKESTGGRPDMMRAGRGEFTAEGIGMENLAKLLGMRVGRPAIDHTAW